MDHHKDLFEHDVHLGNESNYPWEDEDEDIEEQEPEVNHEDKGKGVVLELA